MLAELGELVELVELVELAELVVLVVALQSAGAGVVPSRRGAWTCAVLPVAAAP